jgi:hypothetical protein
MRIRFCALALALAAACTSTPQEQVLTGKVTTSGALAVRAISNGNVVTAARVRSDGSFTLSLPAGSQYELQVLTSSGVQHVLDRNSDALAFRVCAPTDPFDLGGMGHGGGMGQGGGMGSGSGGCDQPPPPDCDPSTGQMCPPPQCDPMDPNCQPPPQCDPMDPNCQPPMCDPTTGVCCDPDGNCTTMCDPMTDPTCWPPPPPPNCDPTTDPNCQPGCDPSTGQMCPPPPPMCDPTTDPNCPPPVQCDANGVCCDASGNCMQPCDPMTQADCPTPPPPCMDPTDPNTCQDPCMGDPMQCGCDPSEDPSMCWPPPPPCDASGNCGSGMMPDHPPGDFGCGS